MPQYLTDDDSELIQMMAWYHQATSHHQDNVDQDVSPYGITRLQ